MDIEQVCAFLAKCRIVDLSKKVDPGQAEGPLDTGRRKYEIKQFSFPPGEIMHLIEMESHISTHIEAPSHFVPVRYGKPANDISEIDLSRFFGMGVLVDCLGLGPKTRIGAEILSRFSIQQGDVVLIGKGLHSGVDRPYLVKEGIEYLLKKKIKMVGVDDTVFPEDPQYAMRDLEGYFCHDLMLSNGIPIIEGLANLGELKKPRFLFFGFPAKMGGLESFPIRAVAVEEP